MPLPIAHSAAGLASYVLFRGNKTRALQLSTQIRLVAVAVVAANLPDLDFVPGLLIGKPSAFHHGVSHSLLAASLFGIGVFLVAQRFLESVSKGTLLLVCLVASLSHPVFDYLSVDTSYPYGVPLFWPFDNAYHISPLKVFDDVTRSQTSNQVFLSTVLNFHNLMNVVREMLFFVGLVMAALAIDNASSRRRLIYLSITFLLLFCVGRLLLP